MQDRDEKRGQEESCGQPCRQQKQAHRSIPLFDLPDRLGLVGLLDDVNDVVPVHRPPTQEEKHGSNIDRKEQRQDIGLRIKGEDHLLGVHQKQAEQAPDSPGQRSPQHAAGHAGAKGDGSQVFAQLPFYLPPGGPQG